MSKLLNKSRIDYQVAKDSYAKYVGDELYADITCYHLQQAVEKALKYWITVKGSVFSKTHNIAELINQLDKLGVTVPFELEMLATTLTGWEADSRYNDDFSATTRQIEMALKVYENLYNMILNDISSDSVDEES